jgi:hypothetical protein
VAAYRSSSQYIEKVNFKPFRKKIHHELIWIWDLTCFGVVGKLLNYVVYWFKNKN